MRDEVVSLIRRVLGPGAEVTRREQRWLALTDREVAFVADDEPGWRRLVAEARLAERWRGAGLPAPRVVAELPGERLQVRERLLGLTGDLVEFRLFGVDPAGVDRYAERAPLTPFGARLAASYGELAARIAATTTAAEGAALGLSTHPPVDLDEAERHLFESAASRAAVERLAGYRAWLEAPTPLDVVVHGDLHFHNLALAESGEISGVFDLDAAAVSTRWTDLQYASGLGPRFLRRATEAYAATSGVVVDDEAVRRAHLLVALGHLRWHLPGRPRHHRVVAWVEAALLAG